MNDQFKMVTDTIHKGGVEIKSQAEEYGYAHKKIKDTVEFLLKAYPSPDGSEIAKSIEGYEPMLNRMQTKLEANGEFGVYASNTTVSTSEDIVDNIAKNV